MKKYLLLFILLLAVPHSLRAEGEIFNGDLVKIKENDTVYYIMNDTRHAFPTLAIYNSWYNGAFSRIKIITQEELTLFTLGRNVPYRPGTRLIKIMSESSVYAVERNGVLRKIPDEKTARTLYGIDWATRVDDLPDSLFQSYTRGIELTAVAHSDETLISYPDGDEIFILDAGKKRKLIQDISSLAVKRDISSFSFNKEDVIETEIPYPDGAPIETGLNRFSHIFEESWGVFENTDFTIRYPQKWDIVFSQTETYPVSFHSTQQSSLAYAPHLFITIRDLLDSETYSSIFETTRNDYEEDGYAFLSSGTGTMDNLPYKSMVMAHYIDKDTAILVEHFIVEDGGRIIEMGGFSSAFSQIYYYDNYFFPMLDSFQLK